MKFTYKTFLFIAAFAIAAKAFAGHGWSRVNYTNSTIFTGIITVNDLPADSGDVIGIFVNGECRMVSVVKVVDGVAYVSAVLHGEKVETATIKYWCSKTDKIYDVDTTITTAPSHEIMEFPIKIKSDTESSDDQKVLVRPIVSIAPSVTKSFVTVQSNKEINQIKVINYIGKTILISKGDNDKTIDLSSQANGIYFISIYTNDGNITTKRIVKN